MAKHLKDLNGPSMEGLMVGARNSESMRFNVGKGAVTRIVMLSLFLRVSLCGSGGRVVTFWFHFPLDSPC